MKPKIYWESLNTEERGELASDTGKSKNQLSRIFNGLDYASLTLATLIASHCDGHINALDLVSPENRKAFQVISGQK